MPRFQPRECTAVLMAGGKSSRMGRDKAWLTHQGRSLWDFQLEKLHRVASEVIISARENTFANVSTGCLIIYDEGPAVGPLGGLRAACKAATFDRLLLLGVDMPAMTGDYLATLIEEASGEAGVIPHFQGFYQGLAAVYPRRIHALLETLLSTSDHSFQELNRQAVAQGIMRARQVKSEEEGLFQNWNTPEDRL